jgi:hypothetical protein
VILIVLGAGFLLRNMGYDLPERWWTLLLLVPAAASLGAAIGSYRAAGATPEAIGELFGGVIFTMLALALYFGVDWGMFWPVVLIIAGAGILIRGYWRR